MQRALKKACMQHITQSADSAQAVYSEMHLLSMLLFLLLPRSPFLVGPDEQNTVVCEFQHRAGSKGVDKEKEMSDKLDAGYTSMQGVFGYIMM